MKSNQSLSEITASVVPQLEQVMQQEKPDMVLVHGDTMTTFTGSLTAMYNQVPIGHVEAGLRTWDKRAPFPEEMNRQMVGVMADLHFAPTDNAASNLEREGKSKKNDRRDR